MGVAEVNITNETSEDICFDEDLVKEVSDLMHNLKLKDEEGNLVELISKDGVFLNLLISSFITEAGRVVYISFQVHKEYTKKVHFTTTNILVTSFGNKIKCTNLDKYGRFFFVLPHHINEYSLNVF
ncbi:hypothetical protein A9Q91_03020 [Candidatus Gracilibacteria bacterium 28_42_T64]|nr:hypothetical protein A9Q91_03020 [Candidatus Gracilibacteria bacterium 28_42_T64]